LGERVARQWRDRGEKVAVVTRSFRRAAVLVNQGNTPIVADVCRPDTLQNLPPADCVLFSVGFDPAGGNSIEEVYAGGVRNVLAALSTAVERFIYISTTGVYGPADGEWVDETTPPDPRREGGRASLAAEQVLAAHPLGRRATILRLAGIYGPGRVPFLDKLRSGEAIPAAVDGYLNLIHVDDAATIVVAAAECCNPVADGPHVYCVSDGHPVKRINYFREVARQIGAPSPVLVEPDSNSPRARRAASDRRIRSTRVLSDFGVALAYPDYVAGLSAILKT
jgi:nucleoside-diphosphate-sugar epimerase